MSDLTDADVKAMRQQKDLVAFIKQTSQEAKARCAARLALVRRHPDLVQQIVDLLGHLNWNGYLAPEFDAMGQRNTCLRHTGLLTILAAADERNRIR